MIGGSCHCGAVTFACRICGCITHWSSTQEEFPDNMAVNARLAEPEDLAAIRIRRFDGVDTWRYLED